MFFNDHFTNLKCNLCKKDLGGYIFSYLPVNSIDGDLSITNIVSKQGGILILFCDKCAKKIAEVDNNENL